MKLRSTRAKITLVFLGLGIIVLTSYAAWKTWFHFPSSPELTPFVQARPGVPIVFTSRATTASLEAAAPEGEGYEYPGKISWASSEGRLRRLDPDGKVYELTWGRTLPDGSTLIDVMSPSIMRDGKRIVFAGRKAPPDPGRFRIYEVGVNGSYLRQITGGPDDPGCNAVPPLRYASDGSTMSDEDRKRLDYDDVDPVDRGDGGIVFATSRAPDLGRGHSRRATQLWQLLPEHRTPIPLTANRNNDRWPVMVANNYVFFSMWSRNRETVSADRKDVVPWESNGSFATNPTDVWIGTRVLPDGDQFGYTIKIARAVWRQRPMFNGKVAFMTSGERPGTFRLAQAEVGLIQIAPSSLSATNEMPAQSGDSLVWGPDRDETGLQLSAVTPTPHPGNRVVFAAAPIGENGVTDPASYGLYWSSDDWSARPSPNAEPLFNDPRLVDTEPVAVYQRDYPTKVPERPQQKGRNPPEKISLLNGHVYQGPFAFHENPVTFSPGAFPPSQKMDTGAGPVFPAFANVKAIAVYAARRDRFDDPRVLRVPGSYERILTLPLENDGPRAVARVWLPTESPHVLAGLDAEGKIAKLQSSSADSRGRRATFYAVAGDHYSGSKPGTYNFCLGCHAGHTFNPIDPTEKMAK
ncbi:MAG: hypothetical protein EXS09_04350 [Gemmataceae bacterium]|nr:hypothetical protein [Gemmataceae bacterium]